MGLRCQTVAAMACMKSLLMVFNFVFWLSGIVILAIGIWMEVELYKYMEISTEFSGTAPYVLIGTGALIILLGSFACCCTVKGQPVLLYVYGAFLFVIFVLELGAGISMFAYRNKLAAGFDIGLNQSISNYRTESSTKSADIDAIQTTLHCCGNHGFNDWIEMNPPIPPSCCKISNCDVNEEDQVYHVGCYDKVVDFLNENVGIVAGSAIGIGFFPLLGMILSCCLAGTINRAKYEQMA
ncbi:hypothetical protein RN001_007869 [Aquatica leii]|uniref:Tetraspanin n=1 Tax=Aquatica leii TaxID=1421715 RepID=A0AAN7QIM8_9COLE|nr:hypothetical protein RN001_007869 [Aquatica leii]